MKLAVKSDIRKLKKAASLLYSVSATIIECNQRELQETYAQCFGFESFEDFSSEASKNAEKGSVIAEFAVNESVPTQFISKKLATDLFYFNECFPHSCVDFPEYTPNETEEPLGRLALLALQCAYQEGVNTTDCYHSYIDTKTGKLIIQETLYGQIKGYFFTCQYSSLLDDINLGNPIRTGPFSVLRSNTDNLGIRALMLNHLCQIGTLDSVCECINSGLTEIECLLTPKKGEKLKLDIKHYSLQPLSIRCFLDTCCHYMINHPEISKMQPTLESRLLAIVEQKRLDDITIRHSVYLNGYLNGKKIKTLNEQFPDSPDISKAEGPD